MSLHVLKLYIGSVWGFVVLSITCNHAHALKQYLYYYPEKRLYC